MRLVDQTAFRIATVILVMLVMACGKDNGKGPDNGPERPVIAQLILNDGVSFTLTREITVAAICTDGGTPSAIRISEDPSFGGAVWVDYQPEVPFQLSPGDGLKMVHAQVRNAQDDMSGIATKEIVLAEEMTVVGLSPVLAGKSGTSEASQPRVLELWVANVPAMYSGQFKLAFDPGRIQVTQVEVNLAGHILGLTGATVLVSDARFDNDTGTVLVGAAGQMSGFTGVTGSGPFARITFAPVGSISTSVPVFFEHESTTGVRVYQEGVPPIPLEGVLYVDGQIAP